MEEIDILRVEHANDVTTIQELRMCLEDEKRGSLIELYIYIYIYSVLVFYASPLFNIFIYTFWWLETQTNWTQLHNLHAAPIQCSKYYAYLCRKLKNALRAISVEYETIKIKAIDKDSLMDGRCYTNIQTELET